MTTAKESELSRKAMLTRRAYSLEQEKIEIRRKLWKEIGEEEILTRGCLANIMEKDVWKVQGKEENVKTSAVEGFAGTETEHDRAAADNKSVVAQFLRGIFSVVNSSTIIHHHSSNNNRQQYHHAWMSSTIIHQSIIIQSSSS